MSRFAKAEVIENQALHPEYNLITLSPMLPLKKPDPGQFYMVGLPQDPLLKRPFSHFRETTNGDIQIFFKIKGKGTALLKNLKRGSVVEVLGPLGRPYPLSSGGETIVVAGGVGIASLYSFIELSNRPFVFYGVRRSEELFFIDDVRKYSKEVFISTEDGSAGEKGLITDRLERFLSNLKSPFTVYACGPSGMLKRVSEITIRWGGLGYLSVEERMACGLGACLGCVIKTRRGYERVCKEGPVFDLRDILW